MIRQSFNRHCEERSDEAIQLMVLDCHGVLRLAMTGKGVFWGY